MRIWLALLVAPSIALACQAVMYALVTPSCAMQSRAVLHGVAVVCLAATLVFALLARREWQLRALTATGGPDSDNPDPPTSRRFLAIAATGVALMSSLVIAAMWLTVWVLSPCWS